ncbi:ABC transporter substrate-binding protein [Mycolicibacterium holsaticum]|uniref:ABC transporter substrate-binding protein n=1 Tax=Mycolicibacterium holsaticum TaxID=152142 RepID=A0A1E3RTR4_9MYCO|nr:ABC transporter substrate-binding protein [Mycolicibacterium holsaticum]ODQ93220.1 ABC transporter substrate-binding protein [Mycolicibacterium holsaticum]QZA13343.1 ABC transporter substrate-binding protein [Mycolicibacterium holsaticum DSM 44478 = JCM 12374]UNC09189.1 amino acid ABC transporter substrate-binding protein [Mycolicibacterium holsaticum DSM 44478 = JCM 12374]
MRIAWKLGALLAVLVALTSCAPIARDAAPRVEDCSEDQLATLYKGVFTFGTDQPVYPPWYIGDNPTNGEGFESALAYAVAARMGYTGEDVRWVRVPFSEALSNGPKSFDANLSQFSITDQRRAVVDFSSPYFDVTQAVVTVKSSPAAHAASLEDLKPLKLGAQVGTTSYTAAMAMRSANPVEVYNTNGDAKLALREGEIDALVADLPTAFAVADEIRDGVMVGQLPATTDDAEQFGIVLDKGSPLTRCVSSVIDALRADGTLAALQTTWLTDAGKAPVLT